MNEFGDSKARREPVKRALAQDRIIALDALRCIAALIVLAQHFRLVFELSWPEWLTKGVFDSKAAVMLFFVLSGYVLALSLLGKAPSLGAYVKFGIRRVLRLFPVYWAALVLAFVVLFAVQQRGAGQVNGQPVLFLDGVGLQFKQWVLHGLLVLPGMKSDFALPPVWTLMTEAKVSLIFPLLAWTILRMRLSYAVAVILLLVFGSHWLDAHVVGTAAFLGMFALGSGLCRVPPTLWSRVSSMAWFGLLIFGVALYAAISWRYVMPSVWMGYYLCGLGSWILIAATIHWDFMRAALTRLQRWLRVDLSYGIYILHFPIMVATKKLAGQGVAGQPWLAFLCILFGTVTCALGLHFVLEKPAIELGRWLTRSR